MTSDETATPAPSADERKDQSTQHMPRLPLPGMPVAMPTGMPGRVLWWGGLAAIAALGVVEWPVAALVGAGSWVAEQYAKEDAKSAAQTSAAEQRQTGPHKPSPA